jgi:hypothetical protein
MPVHDCDQLIVVDVPKPVIKMRLTKESQVSKQLAKPNIGRQGYQLR